MLTLRGVTTGAVLLFISGAAVDGAIAQTATDTPGKPLQLLRIIEAPARPKAVAHNRIHAALHRAAGHRTFAAKIGKHHTVVAEAKVEPGEPTLQDAAAPALGTEDADTAIPAVAAAEPAPAPLPAVAPAGDPAMGPLIVGNQAVEAASQTGVNAIDVAVDTTGSGPVNAPAADAPVPAKTNDVPSSDKVAAIAAPAVAVVSESTSKSDSIKASATAPATQAAQAANAAVGSPGWIAQVMAALAGAVAAGAIAWFRLRAAADLRLKFSRRPSTS